jgi:hypothetical protein
MQDKINQFINQNNNLSVEVEDSNALNQCMDLIFKWCDVLGIPREAVRHQYAYQVWTSPSDTTRKYFDLVSNSPTNIPPAGAIVVFRQTTGIPLGHIAIETGKSDLNNLITFDQNWDTPNNHHVDARGFWVPFCRTVIHANYYGCAGWLIPKNLPKGDDVLLNLIQNVINGGGDPRSKINQIKTILA